ncbi:MAG: hypothetical protein ACYTXA_25745 [Nostoc sp.]
MINPNKEIPFSINPNVPFQSSNQIAKATGKANHWKLMLVTSCRAIQTPPISAAKTRKSTTISATSAMI